MAVSTIPVPQVASTKQFLSVTAGKTLTITVGSTGVVGIFVGVMSAYTADSAVYWLDGYARKTQWHHVNAIVPGSNVTATATETGFAITNSGQNTVNLALIVFESVPDTTTFTVS